MASPIDPKRIRTDLETQIRVTMNEETIKEYAEAMEAGCVFPPLRAFFDEPNDLIILADGFHRLAAHNRVKPNDPILVELILGTINDAQWESIGANQSHGLRRTNEDKRNATQQALLHPNGVDMTDRSIAEHVGVSHTTVQNIRHELEASGKICQIETRTVKRGDQVYQQKSSQINFGRTPPPPGEMCCHCVCFKEDRCTNDDQTRLPWSPACEDFAKLVEDVPKRNVPPPDYDNIVICDDKKPYKRSDSLHQNRRLQGCLKVYLPSDNPSMFAVELRNRWPVEYLVDCIAALKQLLTDKGD